MIVVSVEEQAFSRWAGERQLALLRTAVLLTGDRHRAGDLVQEALTQVALRWRRLQDARPEAYARQVIVRGNISWWRKHRHEVVLDVYDDAAASPAETGDAERRIVLDRALAALTPRQRATVVLRYYDDLSERRPPRRWACPSAPSRARPTSRSAGCGRPRPSSPS